jgi:hypothetical protein
VYEFSEVFAAFGAVFLTQKGTETRRQDTPLSQHRAVEQ